MSTPQNIQFKNLKETLFVKKGDSGYNELKKVNNDGNWVDYVNEMLQNQISVRYDYSTDTFTIIPLFKNLSENFNLGVEDNYEESIEIEDILNEVIPDAIEKGIENAFNKLKNEMFNGVEYSDSETNEVNQNNTSNLKGIDWTQEIQIEKDEEYIHPDLERLVGERGMGNSCIPPEYEEEVTFDDDNKYYSVEEEIDENEEVYNNCEKQIDVDGTPVTLVLNNIFITNSEVSFINEMAKKANTTLKGLNGEDELLEIYVENKEGKIEVVECIDKKDTIFPFVCKNKQFRNLNEAIEYTNVNLDVVTSRIFNNSINESTYNRGFKESKESDIFDWMKEASINVNETWTVRDLGYVNLKNGLNERYSNITQLDKVENTLMVNESGDYILFKGNLKERSKIGVEKEIIKENLNRRSSLGNYKVVGIFENTLEGLGEIMYQSKKAEIKLFNWK